MITDLLPWVCNHDDKCVECLCIYLSHTKLAWLSLSYNNITDNDGVLYLLNTNHKLTVLKLFDNKITDVEHVHKLFTVGL